MKKNQDKTEATPLLHRSLKMPADLDAKIAAIAEAEDRSWSYIIIKAAREMVERAEKKRSGRG